MDPRAPGFKYSLFSMMLAQEIEDEEIQEDRLPIAIIVAGAEAAEVNRLLQIET
jgi:hypothetical protein